MVLEDDVAQSLVLARRSGDKCYLVTMNGDAAAKLRAPLKFLGKGQWTMHAFGDKPDEPDYRAVVESKQDVNASASLSLSLAPAGGFAAIFGSPTQENK